MKRCLLLLVVMLLTACSGEVEPPQSFPMGYTVAEGKEVALALPAEWTAVPVSKSDFADVADHLRAENPELANQIDVMAQEIEDDTLRLAAFHQDAVTSVNIAAESVSLFESLDNQTEATRRGLEDIGYEITASEKVTINHHEAIRLEGRITLNNGVTMALVQYTLIAGGTAYSISFGTPAYQVEEFKAEFEEIANTFHTVE